MSVILDVKENSEPLWIARPAHWPQASAMTIDEWNRRVEEDLLAGREAEILACVAPEKRSQMADALSEWKNSLRERGQSSSASASSPTARPAIPQRKAA